MAASCSVCSRQGKGKEKSDYEDRMILELCGHMHRALLFTANLAIEVGVKMGNCVQQIQNLLQVRMFAHLASFTEFIR